MVLSAIITVCLSLAALLLGMFVNLIVMTPKTPVVKFTWFGLVLIKLSFRVSMLIRFVNMKTVYLVCTKDFSNDLPFFNCEPMFVCTTMKKAQNMKSVLPAAPDGCERDIIELRLY